MPDASVSAIAMSLGINANVSRKWLWVSIAVPLD